MVNYNDWTMLSNLWGAKLTMVIGSNWLTSGAEYWLRESCLLTSGGPGRQINDPFGLYP